MSVGDAVAVGRRSPQKEKVPLPLPRDNPLG